MQHDDIVACKCPCVTVSLEELFCVAPASAGRGSSSSTDSGSSASAATEVFLREDSNSSVASYAPKAQSSVKAKAAGRCAAIDSGFRCRKSPAGRQSPGGGGQRRGAPGAMRQDCRLGPLHRHYQSLCKQVRQPASFGGNMQVLRLQAVHVSSSLVEHGAQYDPQIPSVQMVHEHVQTLGFGDFQCMVTDLMSRVLTCRLAKNKGDSAVSLAVAGKDIMTALADSRVYKHLLSGGS